MKRSNDVKTKNADNGRTDGKILDQSKEDKVLLDMDEREHQHRLRTGELGSSGQDKDENVGTQVLIHSDQGSNSQGNDSDAQLRQSDLRESRSPITGNNEGQHDGRQEEKQIEGPIHGQNPVQNGSQSDLENGQDKGKTEGTMSDLQKHSKSNGEKEEKKITSLPVSTFIELDKYGRVLAKNNAELLRSCNFAVGQDGIPKRFSTPQSLFWAIQYIRSFKGVLPDNAIKDVAMINGSPVLFGDSPLALCIHGGQMTYFKEQQFDKDYNIICFENKNLHLKAYGAVVFIRRAESDIQSFAFTMDDAEQAKLYPANGSTPWMKYTKTMLTRRARSIALKSLFADKLAGVIIGEYDHHSNDPDMKDVSPEKTLANELNNLGSTEEPGINS